MKFIDYERLKTDPLYRHAIKMERLAEEQAKDLAKTRNKGNPPPIKTKINHGNGNEGQFTLFLFLVAGLWMLFHRGGDELAPPPPLADNMHGTYSCVDNPAARKPDPKISLHYKVISYAHDGYPLSAVFYKVGPVPAGGKAPIDLNEIEKKSSSCAKAYKALQKLGVS